MLKGHGNYVTIITSRYNNEARILVVLEGKKQSTIEVYLATIPAKKKTITAVCLDMCDGYINAVKAKLSKDVPVIVDRFHVVQLLHKRLDKLRSSELKRLKKQLPEEDYKKLTTWVEKVNESNVTSLKTFAKTVSKYQSYICGYFIVRQTSGWVEGTNNKIKVTKRRCYGLTNLKHFFQRIFLDLEGNQFFSQNQGVSMTC